jgi:hypothetical protein
VQRLQSPPLNASPNGLRRRAYGRVDGALECGIPPLHNHAGKATQNHFDVTLVIDAAFRPVDVGQAYGDPFNRGCELPKPHPELSRDVISIPAIEGGAKYSYMARRLYLRSPSTYVLGRTRH